MFSAFELFVAGLPPLWAGILGEPRHEVIPETHENGHETAATFGVVGGFVLMMLLDGDLGVTV